jgi:hypothetical protein
VRPQCLELTEHLDIALFIHFVKSWDGTKYSGFLLRKDGLTPFHFSFEEEIEARRSQF